MSLSKFITERLKITYNSKSANILKPKTRGELISLIEQELEHQGPDADLNFIDTSLITDMSCLFSGFNIENIKIDQWDVSNVDNMYRMFNLCTSYNGDLSNWDVSNVENMYGMFNGCMSFTGEGIGNWNVLNVTNMSTMFMGCKVLNPDLSGWDVSNVNDMRGMFDMAKSFEGKGLDKWRTTQLTDTKQMFYGCDNFNCDLSGWDVSNVTTMLSMFESCYKFDSNLGNWDVSNVTDMKWMFRNCYNFKGTGLEMWNTSNVITMDSMFDGCKKLNVDLSSWNVSKVGPYNTFKLKSGTPPKFNN